MDRETCQSLAATFEHLSQCPCDGRQDGVLARVEPHASCRPLADACAAREYTHDSSERAHCAKIACCDASYPELKIAERFAYCHCPLRR